MIFKVFLLVSNNEESSNNILKKKFQFKELVFAIEICIPQRGIVLTFYTDPLENRGSPNKRYSNAST